MEVLEAILTRRSVRQYQTTPLPEAIVPHSLIVLGYPAESPPWENRFRPDRICHNGWTT